MEHITHLNTFKEYEFFSNFNLVSQIILKLSKKYPKNKEIQNSVSAMKQIGFQTNEWILNEGVYNRALDKYRADKNRAVERARRAEDELQKLKEKFLL